MTFMTTTETKVFAYRQGAWLSALKDSPQVDDTLDTTATLPPERARGATGRRLPAGTHLVLAECRYPQTPALAADQEQPAGERLGRLLIAALGLQRREPSNRFNDHRSVASVRSKFPVHVFVVACDGSSAYLDLHRHALVDLPDPVTAGGDLARLLPASGDVTVIIAARYTDLPTPYGRLRCALGLLETGINLRALHIAADLMDVRVRLRMDGADTSAAARLVAGSGPGAWSVPLVLTLEGAGPLPSSSPLPGSAEAGPSRYATEDSLLERESGHASLLEAAQVTAPLTGLLCATEEPVRGVPDLTARDLGTARVDWARALWNRSAGRVPETVMGFSARPAVLGEDFLADMLAWHAAPAPGPLLAEVGRRVRTTVALQAVAGLPTGRYTAESGRLELELEDPELMRKLQDNFSYPLTKDQDCGLRHANATWVFSADLDDILTDFGPAGWSLLQLWCGWVTHGLCTAAGAHGLFARPARSFEEFWLQQALDLPRESIPVFTVSCGRSRFAETMLDLRI